MKESKIILIIFVIILMAYAVTNFFTEDVKAPKTQIMPWQSYIDNNGNTVAFNLTIGHSDLTDAMRLFGSEVEASLFENEDKKTDLEIYFSKTRVAGIDGKVILNLYSDDKSMEILGNNIKDSTVMPSGVRKTSFNPAADSSMFNLKIKSITFIPRADLDSDVITQRFGKPESVDISEQGEQYWHYPNKGLRIILDDEGREMLEYFNQ